MKKEEKEKKEGEPDQGTQVGPNEHEGGADSYLESD